MAAVCPALLSFMLVALTLTSYHCYSSHERATSYANEEREDRNLTVYAMAVGQGDGNIILCPNGRDLIAVDMGAKFLIFTNGSYYLLKEKFKDLENKIKIHIVITHPDEDHYSFLPESFHEDDQLMKSIKEVVLGGMTTIKQVRIRDFNPGLVRYVRMFQ